MHTATKQVLSQTTCFPNAHACKAYVQLKTIKNALKFDHKASCSHTRTRSAQVISYTPCFFLRFDS